MQEGTDGFQVVKRKKSSRARLKPAHNAEAGREEVPAGEVCRLVTEILRTAVSRDFHSEVTGAVERALESNAPGMKPEGLVCYGIGRIGSCRVARQQLALLLAFREQWKPTHTLVYDPVLCPGEVEALRQLGCCIADRNELCRHTTHGNTLFFMPHCAMGLYNNLLWANWGPTRLGAVVLIGNSFQSYKERIPSEQLRDKAHFISAVLPYCVEEPLPSTSNYSVLNDTAVHLFPTRLLQHAPADTWGEQAPPPIDPNDQEINTTELTFDIQQMKH